DCVNVMPLFVTPLPSNAPGGLRTDATTDWAPFSGPPVKLHPYPARNTVLSFPNHGSDQLNPNDGAKLLYVSGYACLSGCGEFFPMNSIVVGEPQEMPESPASAPTVVAARLLALCVVPKHFKWS